MMYPFEEYNREGLEANSSQKLSKQEKAITNKLGELLKIIVKRAGEAVVYGDLYKIDRFLKLKLEVSDEVEEEIANALFKGVDEGVRLVIEKMQEALDELKGYRGNLY